MGTSFYAHAKPTVFQLFFSGTAFSGATVGMTAASSRFVDVALRELSRAQQLCRLDWSPFQVNASSIVISLTGDPQELSVAVPVMITELAKVSFNINLKKSVVLNCPELAAQES